MSYVSTPSANRLEDPSESERATYETGPDRFVNLATLGSFRVFNAAAISPDPARFNCFAWSVGFTDRWIEGGTRDEMVRLYQAYMFRQCQAPQAEVELYDIAGAPPTLTRTIRGRSAQAARPGRPAVAATPDRVVTYNNNRALVMHAHRRDYPALDQAPNRGCSSKLAAGALIAHNRFALADNRPWGSGNPQIVYGSIYQWWQRDPATHPIFPANAANAYPAPGHYPDDRIFAGGRGAYPPGHPGNTIGLPGAAAGNNSGAAGGNTTALARRPGSSSSTVSSGTNSSGHSRTSSATSISSAGGAKPAAPPPKPVVFMAASGKPYPNIPLMAPYARIPPASAAAVKAATAKAAAVSKASPALASAFAKAWADFLVAWRQISRSPFGDHASLCVRTAEFAALAKLAGGGKAARAVVDLLVHRLATEPHAFVGVYLYNFLERDANFLVYPKDLYSYSVLQRHANLVVEMNAARQ